jgi:cytidylate kinase
VAKSEEGKVITIDGPAGSGKSTTAKLVARELEFLYLDTGALYRAIAVLALDKGVSLEDGSSLAALARSADLNVRLTDGNQRVSSGSLDLTPRIRTAEIDAAVSPVSAVPEVRAAMLSLQRAQRRPPGLVAEGRDLGSVVFPDADLKIFMVADLPVRAHRRVIERNAKGESADEQAEMQALARRDQLDSSRPVAPLSRPHDAIDVDTSNLTIREQVARVVTLFRERFDA